MTEDREYMITDEEEAIERLNELYAEAKANPHGISSLSEPRHAIMIHTSGWIVTPMISIGIQSARNYIRKAFKEGRETISRYINNENAWLTSGEVVCRLELSKYNIRLDMTTQNIVRTDESEAKQQLMKEAREEIYAEV